MDDATGATLPQEGHVRLSDFLGRGKPIPVRTSTSWRGVKSGKYPAPVKLGANATAWRVEDIRDVIERTNRGEMAGTA